MKSILMAVAVLLLLTSPALAQEPKSETVFVRDENFRITGIVKDGVIYDRNFKVIGTVDKNGKITDDHFRTKGFVKPQKGGKGK